MKHLHGDVTTLCSSVNSSAGINRPRSKTFEEYEKETDDIWNDKEEDMSVLTNSTELEFVPGEQTGGKKGKGKG